MKAPGSTGARIFVVGASLATAVLVCVLGMGRCSAEHPAFDDGPEAHSDVTLPASRSLPATEVEAATTAVVRAVPAGGCAVA